MHPAVRAHIDGNLSIIRSCIAQIEIAVNLDVAGYQTAEHVGEVRAEKESSGVESHFLDKEHEEMLKQGFAEAFKEPTEQVTDEKISAESSN